jgi:hypothetical protein
MAGLTFDNVQIGKKTLGGTLRLVDSIKLDNVQ